MGFQEQFGGKRVQLSFGVLKFHATVEAVYDETRFPALSLRVIGERARTVGLANARLFFTAQPLLGLEELKKRIPKKLPSFPEDDDELVLEEPVELGGSDILDDLVEVDDGERSLLESEFKAAMDEALSLSTGRTEKWLQDRIGATIEVSDPFGLEIRGTLKRVWKEWTLMFQVERSASEEPATVNWDRTALIVIEQELAGTSSQAREREVTPDEEEDDGGDSLGVLSPLEPSPDSGAAEAEPAHQDARKGS